MPDTSAPDTPAAEPSPFLEIWGAKLWNVANESKTFVACTLLVGIPFLAWVALGWRAGAEAALVATAVVALFTFLLTWPDYPLGLRAILWAWFLLVGAAYVATFGWAELLLPVGLVLAWFFFFTLVVWGTIYYRFLTHEPWRTCRRFYRLVMTNDDSTSGNFFQVMPQMLAPAMLWRLVATQAAWRTPTVLAGTVAAMGLAYAVTSLVHRAWHKRKETGVHPVSENLLPGTKVRRVVQINIDGCRADFTRDPTITATPNLDRMAKQGAEVVGMRTMYPARTSVAFSTMMTGLPPREHGITSNFTYHKVRGETLFDRIEKAGKKGIMVGIAHFDDIAHDNWHLHSIKSFVRNEEADAIFFGEVRRIIESQEPDFLCVDLISVDQTGHMRGALGPDYLKAIESTDEAIGSFVKWLGGRGFFKDGLVMVTSDHGQGRGIGGHGYWGAGERDVPFIVYGANVPAGLLRTEQRSLMDVKPTICGVLGI